MLTREPADATAERESADAGLGDDAGGHDHPVLRGRGVDVAEEASALDAGRFVVRADPDTAHAREVDRQTAVGQGLAGDAVSTAPY